MKQPVPPPWHRTVHVWSIGVLGALLSCTNNAGDRGEPTSIQPAPPQLVLLYVPCTVNKNYLSPYNDDVPYTPNLARFSREARVFTRHQTEAGESALCYASILTGNHAPVHGIFANPMLVAESTSTLLEVFGDNGYETFFWDDHAMARGAVNGRGVAAENIFNRILRGDDTDFVRILQRVHDDPEYRAVVFTAFTVTHAPYPYYLIEGFCNSFPRLCSKLKPHTDGGIDEYLRLYRDNRMQLSYNFPETVERLRLSDAFVENMADTLELAYMANIGYLDTLFGEVIDAIDEHHVEDRALVVFTADHGEVLFRENAPFKWTHGHSLAPEILSVPLLIRAPQLGPVTGKYTQVTRSVDLFPTLADVSRISLSSDAAMMGVSLAHAMMGNEPAPSLLGFSHTAMLPEPWVEFSKPWTLFRTYYPVRAPKYMWTGVRANDTMFKFRNNGTGEFIPEAFDLAKDPYETRNLFDASNPEHIEMLSRLKKYKARLEAAYAARPDSKDDMTMEEQTDRLRTLGYIE